MIEPLSTTSSVIFDAIKYSTALSSIVLSSLAICALTRNLSYATTEYRRLLIGVTIASALNDLYLQIFLDPVFMIPLPCLYIDGLLDRVTDLSPSRCYEIWVSGLAFLGLPYGMCVLYRNQILLPPYHRFRLSMKSKSAFIGCFALLYLSLGPMLELGIEHSHVVIESYFEQLSTGWPSGNRNRTECLKPTAVIAISCIYITVIGGSMALFLLICAHTFYTLSQLKILSAKTRGYHRRLTKSLIVQMLVPSLTLMLPETGFVLQHVIRFKSPEFAPLMLKIIGTHSIAHSLTVIYSTDFIRNFGKMSGRTKGATNNTLRSSAIPTELTNIR